MLFQSQNGVTNEAAYKYPPAVASIYFQDWGRIEARRAENGVGYLGRGNEPLPTK